jgi:hypothetical protein
MFANGFTAELLIASWCAPGSRPFAAKNNTAFPTALW